MRKILLSLACAMFSATGIMAQIEYPATFTEGGVTYSVQNKSEAKTVITGYTSDLPSDLTIKSKITLDGKERNVSINAVSGKSVFADANITSLTIDGNVAFGNYCFNGVTNLEKLRFENYTNTQIGMNVFMDCSSLSDVVLPQSLTSIGKDCFNGTAITSIAIPAGVTEVRYEFKNCTKLTEITFAPDAKLTSLMLGNSTGTAIKSIDIPASVTKLYLNGMAQLETVNFLGETAPANLLNPFCFQNCTALKSINLPEGINTIPTYAFNGCSVLESVTIPSTVTTIGNYAFDGCAALSNIDAKATENWTTIGSWAFNGCSAFNGSFDLSGVKSIDTSAFLNCGITGVTLGENLTTLNSSAFKGSGIQSISLPASLKTMGTQVFQNCKNLTTVTFPETAGLTSIPSKTFSGSGITELLYPDYVTYINSDANSSCKSLKKIKFPANASFKTILSGATSSCGNIEEVILPDNITTIEGSAFANNKIKEISFPGNITSIGTNAFENNQITSVEWPEQITSIPNNVFNNNMITDIVIPATITEIGNSAFMNNPLASITLNEGLKSIKNSAFSSSSATYESIVIPATVNEIGQYAFCYNRNFKHLTLLADDDNNGSNKNFGMYAFGNTSTVLETVTSSNTVPPTINDSAFGSDTYKYAALRVPYGDYNGESIKEKYQNAEGWKKFSQSILTGVDNVEVDDSNAPVEFYNMQGVRIDNPENGIFIRRQGNKTSKVIL